MTRVLYAFLAFVALSSLAQARDLQSCAASAETKKLTGYALGTFMTECLTDPAGSSTALGKPSKASVAPGSAPVADPSRPKLVAVKPTRSAVMPDTAARLPASSGGNQANAPTRTASPAAMKASEALAVSGAPAELRPVPGQRPRDPGPLPATPVAGAKEDRTAEEYRIAQDERADRLDQAGRRPTLGICSDCSGDRRGHTSAMPTASRPDAAPSFE
jgi:hypothetical protein